MAGRTRKPAAPTPAARGVEVVYSVAVSLDGFIAAEDGGVDWLHGAMVKGESYGLPEFMNSIDGLLMGSKTYETTLQMGGGMGSSKPCWVFSQRLPAAEKKGLRITAAPPKDIVAALPEHGVTRAWLFGGGVLAASFLEQGLIDESRARRHAGGARLGHSPLRPAQEIQAARADRVEDLQGRRAGSALQAGQVTRLFISASKGF